MSHRSDGKTFTYYVTINTYDPDNRLVKTQLLYDSRDGCRTCAQRDMVATPRRWLACGERVPPIPNHAAVLHSQKVEQRTGKPYS